jgi:hypothetical protein
MVDLCVMCWCVVRGCLVSECDYCDYCFSFVHCMCEVVKFLEFYVNYKYQLLMNKINHN